MEIDAAAEAVSAPRLRSSFRAALPSRSPLPAGRVGVAVPSRPLSAATRRGLIIARCAAASPAEEQEAIPIEKRFPAFPTVMTSTRSARSSPTGSLSFWLIEHKAGEYAVAIKNVTINDNFFPGHFPERPIMPGVLMVEAMAQVAGIVMLQQLEAGGSQDNFFLAKIDKVRFRKPVVPGDTLVMRVHKRSGLAKMEGKAYVGDDLVCEAEFLLVRRKETS